MLELAPFLPLRGVIVTLRFTAPAAPQFFHQPALSAFLRGLAGSPEAFDRFVRPDTPESGRVSYHSGDHYRFAVTILPGGEAILNSLIEALKRLPASATRTDPRMPFRDNLVLAALHDVWTAKPINDFRELSAYTDDRLAGDTADWRDQTRILWRFLSPARLLKEKSRREGLKGEARFGRNLGDFSAELLLQRLYDGFADLVRRSGASPPPCLERPNCRIDSGHLFWLDADYSDAEGHRQLMGGAAGELLLAFEEAVPEDWLRLMVLGQSIGIGQRPAFGWGRYRLFAAGRESENRTPVSAPGMAPVASFRRCLPAHSLLMLARDEANLAAAFRHVQENKRINLHREWEEPAWEAPDEPEKDVDELPLERLQQALDKLLAGRYVPPALQGKVIEKPEGGVRPLAVPPFFDRVLQRAVVQVLTPAVEPLQSRRSHGYRPGRSRQTACLAIQSAWRAGLTWVYESDLDDFFDSVDRSRLAVRLRALYGEDPAVDALLTWLGLSVEFQGETIERPLGIPQGSPLSPLMANLMLDDFDGDMEVLGFHQVRFADDFVVMCRNREQAEHAHAAAVASLAEHGLRLNPDKTRIVPAADGFRFLGYLFVNDLAVDVSGHPGEKEAPAIPARSWLNRLGGLKPSPSPNTVEITNPLPPGEGRVRAKSLSGSRTLTQNPAAPPLTPTPLPEGEGLNSTTLSPVFPLVAGELGDEGELLCVAGDPTCLVSRNRHLQVQRGEVTLYDVTWSRLGSVVLFGRHHLTAPVLHAALEQDVPIHFASLFGTYRGVLCQNQPQAFGHTLWLRQASLFEDPALATGLAGEVVTARLRHLRETLRQRGLIEAAEQVKDSLASVARSSDLASLNGVEGAATHVFFQALVNLLPPEWGFTARNRQPPKDPLNALLSYGYTLLHGYTVTLLHADGLLPWLGFYHQPHGRHPTLASDLMEPFRHLVERTALSLIQRREIEPENFRRLPDGACLMDPAIRRLYLARLIERLNTPVTAVGAETARTPLQHLHEQNRSLIGWLRDKTPFVAWRTR